MSETEIVLVASGDSRDSADRMCWPAQAEMEARLSAAVEAAGGIGLIGARLDEDASGAEAFRRRVALVGGTSSGHKAVSPETRFVPGVWGPYMSAMVPGLWLNDGGQSATGALIDHVITTHAAHPACLEEARAAGRSLRPGPSARAFHDAKYAVFLRMHDDQMAYRALMDRG